MAGWTGGELMLEMQNANAGCENAKCKMQNADC
jgi:hypothetical protein